MKKIIQIYNKYTKYQEEMYNYLPFFKQYFVLVIFLSSEIEYNFKTC